MIYVILIVADNLDMDAELQLQLAQKTRSDYDVLAEVMDLTRREVWNELYPFLPEVLPADRILDIGCGNGRMIQALPMRVNAYIGLDFSEELIERARTGFGKNHPESKFIVGDALKLPFANQSFETIFMIAVLHQIPGKNAQLRALVEAHRVLKPGGTMLLAVWNLWRGKYLWLVLKSNLKKLLLQHRMDWGDVLIPWKGKGVMRYYHAFTGAELAGFAEHCGFVMMNVSEPGRTRNLILKLRKPKVSS